MTYIQWASVMKADIHYGLGMCPKATYRNVSVDATDEKTTIVNTYLKTIGDESMIPRKLHMLFHVRDEFVDTTEPPFTHKPLGARTVVTPLTKHNVGAKFVIPSLGRTLFIIATTQNI